MASTIKIRRSAIQGAIPTTSQLSLGELGINTFDGKLFLKQSTTGSETGAGTTIVDVTGYSYDWVTNESGIHTSSNVGIGTTNPDGPLVVNAASGFSGNMLDIQKEGVSQFNVNSFGMANLYVQAGFTNEGLSIGATNSAVKTKLSFSDGLFFSGAGTFDVVLRSDAAADTLAQRRSTNAQTLRVYDTYTSATDYHRIAIATARATLSAVSGASVTATGLIPAGAVVMGVTSKVTTALGTTNSTTGYKIGTVADDDRWGDITGTAAGTSSDNRDWTSGTIECFPSATDIIVTAVGGDFDGIGEIYLSVQYMSGQVD